MAGEQDDGEELVLVEVPEEIVPPLEETSAPTKETDSKGVVEHEDEDEDEDEDEGRTGHDAAASGETDEEKRARRRAEKKRRREAFRRHRELEKAEIQQLRQTNAEMAERMRAIEGRNIQHEAVLLGNRQTQLEAQLREAESIIIQARAIGNHADSLEAEEVRNNIRAELNQVARARQAINGRVQAEQAREKTPATPAIDPIVRALAQDWISDNQWVMSDPVAQKKVKDIDASLVSEGYNPKSMKFWNELSKRVGKEVRLTDNDRQQSGTDDGDSSLQQHQSRGPSMSSGNGGGSSRRLRANEVLITPERKKAMIDAGAWEDPDKRKRMLKSFHEWDKNPANKQSAAR